MHEELSVKHFTCNGNFLTWTSELAIMWNAVQLPASAMQSKSMRQRIEDFVTHRAEDPFRRVRQIGKAIWESPEDDSWLLEDACVIPLIPQSESSDIGSDDVTDDSLDDMSDGEAEEALETGGVGGWW